MFRALPTTRIKNKLDHEHGLTHEDVKQLREKYGSNDIIDEEPHHWIQLIKDTLLDPMIWFLFIASFLFFLLHKYPDAIVLLIAVVPIGGMDAFLHWRTQVSTQALSSRLITHARVIRDGKEVVIPSRELVPDDLLIVRAGDYFAADGVVVAANNLQVDESSLTGETYPVTKEKLKTLSNHGADILVDYVHWGFVGSRVLTGEAKIRVVYTGKETMYGEIVESVQKTHQEKTPLQGALGRLVLMLILIATLLCVVLASVRYYQGFGIIDALLSAATLAVVALPDEFPMVFTFFLGVGVYRLAQKHALVKRAVSVENIGRVNFICTDKTGTLTEGYFHIAKYVTARDVSESDLLLMAALASRLDSGDPLDKSIFRKINPKKIAEYVRVNVFPFTEDRKRETALYKKAKSYFAVTKGAPETIFLLCKFKKDEIDFWRERVIELSSLGYKVIACAEKTVKAAEFDETEVDYHLAGLVAFEDPPRPEVFAAIDYCEQTGIKVLMITGDHPATAKKIASDIGLGQGVPNVVTAQDAELMLRKDGGKFLQHVDVIARAVPTQKLDIVKILRHEGHIVGVTGDGVNDVPALRAADVGIAMGERGTQSAREAASIVLLDDNFGSIVNAIDEGKQLFRNLQLSFKYLLLVHTPYVLSAIIIPFLGYPLLYYPIHIVWIELFIHPTSMLVFQNLPNQAGKRQVIPEKKRHISFFSNLDCWQMLFLGIYTSSIAVLTYLITLHYTGAEAAARAYTFAFVGLSHIALTIGLSHLQNVTSRVIVGLSVLMLVFLVQVPAVAHYFDMAPLSLIGWGILTMLSMFTAWLAHRWS